MTQRAVPLEFTVSIGSNPIGEPELMSEKSTGIHPLPAIACDVVALTVAAASDDQFAQSMPSGLHMPSGATVLNVVSGALT